MMKKTVILILLGILFLGCKRDLGKVLIIGDSISIGYTPYVQEALAGKATVVHNEGNAGHTGIGLNKIHDWLPGRPSLLNLLIRTLLRWYAGIIHIRNADIR